jgi:hypothetical protein
LYTNLVNSREIEGDWFPGRCIHYEQMIGDRLT